MLFQKNKKITKLLIQATLIVFVSLSITQVTQIAQAQNNSNNQWALSFSATNMQNVRSSTFAPFNQIQLLADVTYGNTSVPDILVTFKAQDPSNSMNVTSVESTDSNGQAAFSFRLPTEGPNNSSIVGAWQATATIQTTNGPLQKTLSFTIQWSMQITSIILQDSKGQNQTSFSSGNTVTVKLSINNSGLAQNANVTLNMQDSKGNSLNQTQIQNIQVATSNQTIAQAKLQVPKNATAGQASITAALFSGNFEGRNIPASQSKTITFKITTAPKLQPLQMSISLFSWLLVATAIFTFTTLTVFLRRKPYQPSEQPARLPMVPIASSPALPDSSQLAIPGNPSVVILAQQAGLQPLATQLSTMSSTAQRIEALQTALRMERQQLAKDIADLTKTVDEQEKAIMRYFETIRQEMKRLGTYIGDQNIAQTEAKVEQNAQRSEEKIKHEQTIPPPEDKDKQTDIPEQSRPIENTKEPQKDYDTLRQERTEQEDIRTSEHTRED
jgi:hypothetical protein